MSQIEDVQLEISASAATRRRLLEAAGEVFAELGLHNATVRDICKRADANVAAINYHFGDKEKLYREVLAYTGRLAIEKHPIPPADANVSPEEELRQFLTSLLNRMLDTGRPAWHGKLMAREMFEPTGALEFIVDGYVRPQYQRITGIVSRLLGPAATPERNRRCARSIIGQCLFYKHARPVIQRLDGEDLNRIPELIDHIVEFSLGAIARMRQVHSSHAGSEAGKP